MNINNLHFSLLVICLTFTVTTFCQGSSNEVASKMLLQKAQRAVEHLPLPEITDFINARGLDGLNGLEKLNASRLGLCRTFAAVIKQHGEPDKEQISALRKWINKLHSYGVKLRLFGKGTKQDAHFSAVLALAQGYLDCASLMVGEQRMELRYHSD